MISQVTVLPKALHENHCYCNFHLEFHFDFWQQIQSLVYCQLQVLKPIEKLEVNDSYIATCCLRGV